MDRQAKIASLRSQLAESDQKQVQAETELIEKAKKALLRIERPLGIEFLFVGHLHVCDENVMRFCLFDC